MCRGGWRAALLSAATSIDGGRREYLGNSRDTLDIRGFPEERPPEGNRFSV
jgi:hypothetical protein